MDLSDLLSDDHIALSLHTSLKEAHLAFEECSYTHLPIVHEHKLLGLIPAEVVANIYFDRIEDVKTNLDLFFIGDKDSIDQMMHAFANAWTNILPVIGEQNQYLGYVDAIDFMEFLSEMPFFDPKQVSITLQKETLDFTMSEVCQIVETNYSKMLGCYINQQDSKYTQVTLKVSSSNLNELIQLLRSYKYTIMTDLVDDTYLEDLKKRSEYFLKYLNI